MLQRGSALEPALKLGPFRGKLFCRFRNPGKAQDSLEQGLRGVKAFADVGPLSRLADALLGRQEDWDTHACAISA